MKAMGRLIDGIADLPIPRIDFTTPTDERKASVGDGITEAAEWIEAAEKTSAGSAQCLDVDYAVSKPLAH
jgi:hypothetical protein